MLGTTHATNAVLERRKLRRVAVVRIGGPATYAIRPLFGWPADLRETVSAPGEAIVDGGIEFDGREIVPFDPEALARFLGASPGAVEGVAITSVFAPVSAEHELRAAEIVRSALGPDVDVSLSHEIGSIGLLERENATVLNAALVGGRARGDRRRSTALAAHGLAPVTFFAQNDGTLMALDHALRYPVLTIGSGPANSIRGAAYLTGDPRRARHRRRRHVDRRRRARQRLPARVVAGVEIGGIRTNFRMPDLVTIALGGGTVIGAEERPVACRPESVGYRLAGRRSSSAARRRR